MKDIFTYTGYSDTELLELCSPHKARTGSIPWKYWTTEIYSFGKQIRSYGHYPSFLPLYCYSCHGACAGEIKVAPHELDNDAYAYLNSNPDLIKTYKKLSQKPCYCMLSPFVWYRRKNKIEKSSMAKGTLAFPSHSTDAVDVYLDVPKYITALQSLPAKYHPICVCLHMHDIHKGLHKEFLNHEMPVYTAGSALDVRFAQRWYNIVNNFSYTTSNMIGSYSLYSTELGIPFFIQGEEPVFYNNADANIPLGAYNYQTTTYKDLYEMFLNTEDSVSEAQKAYAEKYLGVYDSISRMKTAKILYTAFLKHGRIFADLGKAVKSFRRKISSRVRQKRNKILLPFKTLLQCFHTTRRLSKLGVGFFDMHRLCTNKGGQLRTTLFGKTLTINSAFWYLHGLDELFLQHQYKFQADTDTPRIIDCGANTGLSAIYFKRQHPKARVTAFEPDPAICAILQQNLRAFGYDDVEVVNKAVWTSDESIHFIASGGVGGRIGNSDGENSLSMPACRLRDLLQEPVDFLKIDIEGAEDAVVEDCADSLHNVQNIFIEYHSSEDREQQLDDLLRILKNAGFKYYIKEAWNNQPHPYTNQRTTLFDLQLNIFGYRLGAS